MLLLLLFFFFFRFFIFTFLCSFRRCKLWIDLWVKFEDNQIVSCINLKLTYDRNLRIKLEADSRSNLSYI